MDASATDLVNGHKFKLITDNREVKLIFNNTAAKHPARNEHMGTQEHITITKAFISKKLWFTNMQTLVEEEVKDRSKAAQRIFKTTTNF